MVAGGKVNQIAADSAGVNPAWRDAVVLNYCGVTWEDGTPSSDVQGLISQLKGWIKALHDVAPNDGAYFNEVRLAHLRKGTSARFIRRRPCLRSTGRKPFLARIIRRSRQSKTNTIHTGYSSSWRVSDLRNGTRI